MLLHHSPSMKEVIGKTRFGNDIWLDFEPDVVGYLRFWVVEFVSKDERYDTLCVMETYAQRMHAQGPSRKLENSDLLIENIDAWLKARVALYLGPEALTLAHHGSTDRLRYGLSLIHPAYRW